MRGLGWARTARAGGAIGYEDLGSGVCSTGSSRLPYCQKNGVGIPGCEAACSDDPNCTGYNPNTHGSSCFLFWVSGSPLADPSWSACSNQDQAGDMTGQDGTEGGTCFKKIWRQHAWRSYYKVPRPAPPRPRRASRARPHGGAEGR